VSDTPQRPTHACITCPPPGPNKAWRPADTGYRTCTTCYDKIRELLKDIVRRYLQLNPRPGAAGDHGSRGAPGFGARAPASEHIIAMRDRRSSVVARTWLGADGRLHQESERPPRSVYGVLDTIAWDITEQRSHTGPDPHADVPELARYIDGNLDWLTRQDLVADVHRELRELDAQLKPVTGDPGRRHIGLCPNTVDDGTTTRECGARLYAPLRGDSIQCTSCQRIWPRPEWLRLGDLLDAS
jgi:hypothetical protein